MSQGHWGAYMQQGNLEELNILGGELSKKIDCPIHYPAWNKPMFECKHGITFASYQLKMCFENPKLWQELIKMHNDSKGDN